MASNRQRDDDITAELIAALSRAESEVQRMWTLLRGAWAEASAAKLDHNRALIARLGAQVLLRETLQVLPDGDLRARVEANLAPNDYWQTRAEELEQKRDEAVEALESLEAAIIESLPYRYDDGTGDEARADIRKLRSLLREAHRELATIEAITVSPSDTDGLLDLVRRMKSELDADGGRDDR